MSSEFFDKDRVATLFEPFSAHEKRLQSLAERWGVTTEQAQERAVLEALQRTSAPPVATPKNDPMVVWVEDTLHRVVKLRGTPKRKRKKPPPNP